MSSTRQKAKRQARASDNGTRDEIPPEKVQRTKAPPVTIFCDDLAIEVDGEKYYPHAGELIRLSGGASVADIKMSVDLQKIKDIDISTDEGKERIEEVKFSLMQVVGSLAARLQSWTWTDDAGEPYPTPTREVLETLRFEELMWILSASLKTARKDADRLKGSAPSTTR